MLRRRASVLHRANLYGSLPQFLSITTFTLTFAYFYVLNYVFQTVKKVERKNEDIFRGHYGENGWFNVTFCLAADVFIPSHDSLMVNLKESKEVGLSSSSLLNSSSCSCLSLFSTYNMLS